MFHFLPRRTPKEVQPNNAPRLQTEHQRAFHAIGRNSPLAPLGYTHRGSWQRRNSPHAMFALVALGGDG
jgi:hypothetical protein